MSLPTRAFASADVAARNWATSWMAQHGFWRVVLAMAVLLTATLLFTYLSTLLQSRSRGPGRGYEPPIAPYCMPYFQHLFDFLLNPSQTFRSLHSRYRGQPFTLSMMNTKFHVFHDIATVSHVFAQSRAFVFEPVLASMMENGMGLPAMDQRHFQLPSQAGRDQKDSTSFAAIHHNLWLKYLSGRGLDDIMQVYGEKFACVLEVHLDLHTKGWQIVRWNGLLRRLIFETSTETFFGPRLRQLWPTMWEDYNIFSDATYIGVRSNFLYTIDRRAGSARERMLRAFEQWIEQDLGDKWPATDGIYNAVWGCQLNWERERLARQVGFSPRGRACLHGSFLFVMNVNAMPLTSWFSWCASSSTERLSRFRREAAPLLQQRTGHAMQIDSHALKKSAYIQGLWKEALRLGTATAAARVVTRDTTLEGYVVRKGSVVMLPTALLHHNPHLFPEPEQVRPERWMLNCDASGVRHEKGNRHGDDDSYELPEALLQQRELALRPFGGGRGLCSGRFVAEQEVIGIVAMLLLRFDIEFPPSWCQGYRLNPRSMGYMDPMTETIVRLRVRDGGKVKV